MPVELNKAEQKLAHLIKMGGAEIPESDKASEEEARTAARKVAKEILKRKYAVIDVDEYDAWWEDQLKKRLEQAGGSLGGSEVLLRGQIDALQRELQGARQEAQDANTLVDQARQRETEARRQVDTCQRLADKYSTELQNLRSRPAGIDPKELTRVRNQAEALERDLRAAKQEVATCSVFVKNARAAEAEAKRAEADARNQIEACSNLVTRLKSEALMVVPTGKPSTELVQLQQQVKDLTFKVATAQAVARACEGLRAEELAYYEKRMPRPTGLSQPVSQDFKYTLFAGLLVGGVATMVGAIVLRKIMAPSEPEPEPAPYTPPYTPPKPPSKPSTPRTPPRPPSGRLAGI